MLKQERALDGVILHPWSFKTEHSIYPEKPACIVWELQPRDSSIGTIDILLNITPEKTFAGSCPKHLQGGVYP